MKYFEVRFTITPFDEITSDVLTALLGDAGFEAFVPEEDGMLAYVQQQDYDDDETRRIVSGFEGHDISYTVSEAPDEDWNQTWEEEGFEPIVMDDLVCIHDTRHTDVPSCTYDIVINPRMAFGTGTHPTTRQILRQLCVMSLESKRIIDAGCGTGVLGLLCSMRGASEVFSYDIDEWSVENTRVNAELNHIYNIKVKEGDAAVLPQDGTYDLLIANINRNILLADMPRFAKTLHQGGQLLLSGFYEEDAMSLIEKGRLFGFEIERQNSEDGWAMLLLRLV